MLSHSELRYHTFPVENIPGLIDYTGLAYWYQTGLQGFVFEGNRSRFVQLKKNSGPIEKGEDKMVDSWLTLHFR
jgi:hypothetical protein